MILFTRSFLVAAFERAVKTFAGVLLGFLPAAGTDAVPDLNWGDMLTLAGYATLASVLFSVVSSGVGGTGPSLANEVISPPAVDPGPDVPDHGHIDLALVLVCAAVSVLALIGYHFVIIR